MVLRRQSRSLRERAAASSPCGFCPAAATREWSRSEHRHACRQLVQHHHIEVCLLSTSAASPDKAEVILSRTQRTHSRLSWPERLARNARVSTPRHVTSRLFGVPDSFTASL